MMKTILRKGLPLLLCLVICLTLLSLTASAAEEPVLSGTCGDGVTYVLDSNGTLTISKTGSSYDSGKMTDYTNTGSWPYSAPWYSKRDSIRKIVVESGVTTIGDFAFYFCTNVQNVTIPEGVRKIGCYSFGHCSRLPKLALPSTVVTIDYDAFTGCSTLESITLPAGLTEIGDDAFKECKALSEINIPAGVKTIGSNAFLSCTTLKEITIPANVTSIGASAFEKCSSLKRIRFERSSGSLSIGSNAFALSSGSMDTAVYVADPANPLAAIANYKWSDSKRTVKYFALNTVLPSDEYYDNVLFRYDEIQEGYVAVGHLDDYPSNITIPASIGGVPVVAIGGGAFSGCRYLYSVTISEGIRKIGSSAFYNSGLQSVSIPSTVTSFYNAFYYCTNLTSVTIANGVTLIDSYAFDSCSSLSAINIPASVKSIGYGAFRKCSYLSSVSLKAGVNTISSDVFYNCTSLKTITIPAGVSSIGSNAFENCPLSTINFGHLAEDRLTIGSSAFKVSSSTATSVYVAELANKHSAITGYNWSGSNRTVTYKELAPLASGTEGSLSWTVNGGGVMKITGSGAMRDYTSSSRPSWQAWATKAVALQVGEGITSVGSNAFLISSFKTVTLPSTVRSIGEDAFLSSAVETLNLANGLQTIGVGAFSMCMNLKSVVIPDSVTSIGSQAFFFCDKLTDVRIGNGVTFISSRAFDSCSALKNLTLGSSVKTIGEAAFSNTDIASLNIPDSVTTIGESAFYPCFSLASLELGNGVTSIGKAAFAFSEITSLTIPHSVRSIQEGAFKSCDQLKTVTLGKDLIEVGKEAFANDLALTRINMHGDCPVFGDNAFYLVIAEAHYPTCNTTYDTSTSYFRGGSLTWKPDCGLYSAVHIPGEPVHEHEVPATYDADGSYDEAVYCTVCGAELSRVTETIPMLTTEVPVITAQPASITVAAGKAADFSVTAAGEDLTYQWYVFPNGGDEWNLLEDETGPTLSFTAAADQNGYRYKCVVTNRGGNAESDEAKLTVVTKPKITTQPKAASVKAGKKVTFKVKATGGELKYQWYCMKTGTKKWVKLGGKTKATYSFKATKKMNGYKYYCLVSNKAGKVKSKTVKLTVK